MMHRVLFCILMVCGLVFGQVAVGGECAPGELARLAASDVIEFDTFGTSVAVSGDWAAVLSPNRYEKKHGQGSVYLFQYDGSQWIEKDRIYPPSPVSSTFVAGTIAIAGDYLAVANYLEAPTGDFVAGVYVYRRVGSRWVYDVVLRGSDVQRGERFGASIDMESGRMIVGAPSHEINGRRAVGAAYIFRLEDSIWSEEAKLVASDWRVGDEFGNDVGISGDTAVIGAHRASGVGVGDGAAYVFRTNGGGWFQDTQLQLDRRASIFGNQVAISGTSILVGEAGHPDVVSSGLVHSYRFVDGNWVKGDNLYPEVPRSFDSFGFSIVIEDDIALISAPSDSEHALEAGAVYRFEQTGNAWIQKAKYSHPNPHQSDLFGHSIMLSDQRALVGVPLDDLNGSESGAVFSFEIHCRSCSQDLTGDGVLDKFDVFAYLDLFNASDPAADLTGDGSYDIFDVFAYLDAYSAGCP